MVTVEHEQGVAILRMDDGKANAMNASFLTALRNGLEDASSAPALVLTGRSGFFSGGLDLKVLPGLPADEFQASVNLFEETMRAVMAFPAPVVAAVGGHALAGGAVLLLSCDLAVSARGAHKIGLNETAIGLTLPDFVLELGRHRLLPSAWSPAMVLGQTYAPEDARAVGYVHEVVPAEQLAGRALELALQAARVPKEAYRQTKASLLRRVLEIPLGQLSQTISEQFRHGELRHALGQRG